MRRLMSDLFAPHFRQIFALIKCFYYFQYARYIAHFFTVLAECGVRPVVVFDGGYEASDIKIKWVAKKILRYACVDLPRTVAKKTNGYMDTYVDVLQRIHWLRDLKYGVSYRKKI